MSAAHIRLGETVLEAVVPSDLDDRLLASVGVSAAEMLRLLDNGCVASTVAAAIIPLVAEPPARSVLARAIADEGVRDVRRKVERIYRSALRRKPKKKKDSDDAQSQG